MSLKSSLFIRQSNFEKNIRFIFRMDFQLSQEMKNRIEKNDQQERLDYEVSIFINVSVVNLKI